jgi:SAM-dependent methyltransferase
MPECLVCKREAGNGNFCIYCRYPANVKRLLDFSKDDHVALLSHLHDVLVKFNNASFNDSYLDQAYHELVSFNWLRPENALFSFKMLKAISRHKDHLKYPTLDLGCGDGTFTTILFGGRFQPFADNYGSVDLEKTDIYDHSNGCQKNILSKRPERVGYGVDIKPSSVQNAKDLGVYDRLEIGDIRRLPFEAECVSSAFSNMISDIEEQDLSTAFAEIRRVLRKKCVVMFASPTEHFRSGLYYHPRVQDALSRSKTDEAEKFAEYDRGRSGWQPRSKEFWEKFLRNHSFDLLGYEPFFNIELLKFWDTGFRPYFPYLLQVKEQLSESGRLLETMKVVVEMMKSYFFGFANPRAGSKPTFALVIARRD